MPLPSPTLRTDRLLLRPFRDGDAEALWELHSDRRVLRYWDSPPWTDPSRAQRFLETCRSMEQESTGVRVVMEAGADFAGWMTLNDWNPGFRSAKLGYCLAERAWGHGYATEAGRALLAWAFDTMPLNRVQAECDTRNAASARVLEKLGFRLEGTLREDCVVDGDVSDSWVYGLLRREWDGMGGGPP